MEGIQVASILYNGRVFIGTVWQDEDLNYSGYMKDESLRRVSSGFLDSAIDVVTSHYEKKVTRDFINNIDNAVRIAAEAGINYSQINDYFLSISGGQEWKDTTLAIAKRVNQCIEQIEGAQP